MRDFQIFRARTDRRQTALLAAKAGDDYREADIGHLLVSPDGRQLGFHRNGVFSTVDLQTRAVNEMFRCDHYFCSFDWQESGIVYLDQHDGDRRHNAVLAVYDPDEHTSTVIDAGPFAYPHWVDGSHILVRSGNATLLLYDVPAGCPKVIFGPRESDEGGAGPKPGVRTSAVQ